MRQAYQSIWETFFYHQCLSDDDNLLVSFVTTIIDLEESFAE